MFVPTWLIVFIVVAVLYRHYTVTQVLHELFWWLVAALALGIPFLLYVFWDDGGKAVIGFAILAVFLYDFIVRSWRAFLPIVAGYGTALWIGGTLDFSPGWFLLMLFIGGTFCTMGCLMLIARYLPWMAIPEKAQP